MQNYLEKVIEGQNLTYYEIKEIIEKLLNDEIDSIKFGAFLALLRKKGESLEEIKAFIDTFLERSKKIYLSNEFSIDTCGTGGDSKGTFNISTVSSIILSSFDIKVVKHGNRGITSRSGSADLMEQLGIDINANQEKLEEGIEKIGFGFVFAPNFHPAMKKVAPIRKSLGIKTVFNILGPVLNPAPINYQVVGTFDLDSQNKIFNALNGRRKRYAVVHSDDGLDEISISSSTKILENSLGITKEYFIEPEDFGVNRYDLSEIKSEDPKQNAEITLSIFEGIESPFYYATQINCAFCLYILGLTDNLVEAAKQVERNIKNGLVMKKFNDIKNFYKLGGQ
ncbi:anthranilate phosphoribosyltransferase [Caldicellulosiruptoraceae bacterium PP1]